jgi:hypothetical protein
MSSVITYESEDKTVRIVKLFEDRSGQYVYRLEKGLANKVLSWYHMAIATTTNQTIVDGWIKHYQLQDVNKPAKSKKTKK